MLTTRVLLIATLGLLIVSGLVAGFFTGAMQRVLTPPAGSVMQLMTSASVHTAGTMTPPTTTAVTGGPATATPMMPTQLPTTILAHDDFQRGNQILWGTASDGRNWQGDANTAQSFSITGGTGRITGGQGAFNALLGTGGSNVEVIVAGTVSGFVNGANLGVIARWTDANNWYKALIDGTNFNILKRFKGTSTVIATIPFNTQGGVNYSIRFRAVGATVFARVWRSDTPEPTQWMLTATDTSFSTGQVGVRVVVQNGVEIRITSFMATTASSAV